MPKPCSRLPDERRTARPSRPRPSKAPAIGTPCSVISQAFFAANQTFMGNGAPSATRKIAARRRWRQKARRDARTAGGWRRRLGSRGGRSSTVNLNGAPGLSLTSTSSSAERPANIRGGNAANRLSERSNTRSLESAAKPSLGSVCMPLPASDSSRRLTKPPKSPGRSVHSRQALKSSVVLAGKMIGRDGLATVADGRDYFPLNPRQAVANALLDGDAGLTRVAKCHAGRRFETDNEHLAQRFDLLVVANFDAGDGGRVASGNGDGQFVFAVVVAVRVVRVRIVVVADHHAQHGGRRRGTAHNHGEHCHFAFGDRNDGLLELHEVAHRYRYGLGSGQPRRVGRGHDDQSAAVGLGGDSGTRAGDLPRLRRLGWRWMPCMTSGSPSGSRKPRPRSMVSAAPTSSAIAGNCAATSGGRDVELERTARTMRSA